MTSALVTYIYPNAKEYFQELLLSIKEQTDTEFDFLVFSDGVLEGEMDWNGIRHTFISMSGCPIAIRIRSLAILYKMNYDYYVFADADDTISNNRVEYSKYLLRTYSLVCNDLNIIDKKGAAIDSGIWKVRLNDHFEFSMSFLLDKNIVGFGNSAIRRELLKYKVNIPSTKVVAADWYVFYKLLKLSGESACFSAKMFTNYRQHVLNSAGVRILTLDTLKYSLEVKKCHYQALSLEESLYYLDEITKVEKAISENTIAINNERIPKHLFWWEESKYVNFS